MTRRKPGPFQPCECCGAPVLWVLNVTSQFEHLYNPGREFSGWALRYNERFKVWQVVDMSYRNRWRSRARDEPRLVYAPHRCPIAAWRAYQERTGKEWKVYRRARFRRPEEPVVDTVDGLPDPF